MFNLGNLLLYARRLQQKPQNPCFACSNKIPIKIVCVIAFRLILLFVGVRFILRFQFAFLKAIRLFGVYVFAQSEFTVATVARHSFLFIFFWSDPDT